MNIVIRPNHGLLAANLENQSSTELSFQAGGKQRTAGQDKLSISKQAQNMWNQNGAKNTFLQQLMEQKQQIAERRSQYISHALEKGISPDVMKEKLAEIDAQVREIETQIRELAQEEQRKAMGLDQEEQQNKAGQSQRRETADSEHEKTPPMPNTMNALVSAGNRMKHAGTLKMVQNTLKAEAKSWEHSDPARSAALLGKAEGLNGKLLEISGEVNKELNHAAEKDKHASSHRHQIESKDSDITLAADAVQEARSLE